MTAGSLALALAAALSGAALYVNVVEQPARLALDDSAMLQEWGPSDRRGVAVLTMLSLAAAICGLSQWYEGGDLRWAIGALIAILSWPYSFYVMAPIDNQIIALAPSDIGAARELVRQWGMLELGQTALAVVATGVFLWAL